MGRCAVIGNLAKHTRSRFTDKFDMRMRIVHTGDDHLPVQIDDPRVRAGKASHVLVVTDRDDLPILDRDRTRPLIVAVDGVDIAVDENAVGTIGERRRISRLISGAAREHCSRGDCEQVECKCSHRGNALTVRAGCRMADFIEKGCRR